MTHWITCAHHIMHSAQHTRPTLYSFWLCLCVFFFRSFPSQSNAIWWWLCGLCCYSRASYFTWIIWEWSSFIPSSPPIVSASHSIALIDLLMDRYNGENVFVERKTEKMPLKITSFTYWKCALFPSVRSSRTSNIRYSLMDSIDIRCTPLSTFEQYWLNRANELQAIWSIYLFSSELLEQRRICLTIFSPI